ncbi:MAG: tetratricopeptide repeat protein [Rhodomicrobium sp.]
MADIFISYARADRDYARRLAAYIEDAGLTVWWDMSLQPGEVFRDEIERRIGEARHVIVIWSETSVKSDFVQDEADVARKQNKLVPIRIDGCEPPIGFRRYHTHTVSAWPGDLAPLLAVVGGGEAPAKPASAPAKTAEGFFRGAMAAYDAGDYDRAISDYNQAIRLKPDYADAYNNRGNAYRAKGDNDRAIADYDQAIRLKPDYASAYNNRGASYNEKGDNDRAIADYDQAIRLKPDDASAYINRGNAYRAKGDNDRAIADYDQAIRLKPDYASAYINRGNAYYDKGDNDRAIADYNQAIRLEPDDADAYNNRGAAWYGKGDYARAIGDYDRALQIDPNVKNAAANKALAEAELAKTKK